MQIIEGDILQVFDKADEAFLLHGVSCQPVLHAGLAKQIIAEYPSLLTYHRLTIRNCSSLDSLLGRCTFYQTLLTTDKTKSIVNLYQQIDVGRSIRQIDYDAFRSCLEYFKKGRLRDDIPVYIPKNIGCGLAGGQWSIVLEIIEKVIPEAILVEYSSANLQQT